MKRTLLIFTLLASFFASAQDYNLALFDQAIFYSMYEGTVNQPLPANAVRNTNSSYGRMLTDEDIASIGNTLTLTVTLSPLCDDFDRIGNINLAFVPKDGEYVYNAVQRIELGRFITPFMDLTVEDPYETPYVFQLDNITKILHDESITSVYDLWIEFEVYGYQGSPTQGGAVADHPAECTGRNDVYMGSLDLVSTYNPNLVQGENHFKPLSYKYELKNYTLDGTDAIGQTVRTINFTLDEAVPNAKLYLITSNHGSNPGGEEYVRRDHFIYFDDAEVFNYKPGGLSCVPYRVYNTQFNCIYRICYSNGTWAWRPNNNSSWSWNNWCPGNKIPTRVINLGDLAAGEHSFRIEVPEAQFVDGQGYFPMSVYMQGYSETLGTPDFEHNTFNIHPNPVADIATIETGDQHIKTVTVINALGQTVFEGTSEKIDLSQMQSGIYMVKVQFSNNLTATRKIIKK